MAQNLVSNGLVAVRATETAHCPQCDRAVRISEPFAFGGRDRLRSTLACGHVVAREAVA